LRRGKGVPDQRFNLDTDTMACGVQARFSEPNNSFHLPGVLWYIPAVFVLKAHEPLNLFAIPQALYVEETFMKNIKWLILVILSAGVAFISGCSGTDDDPRELLNGTWTQEYDNGDCDVFVEIALDDNGTFDMVREDTCDDAGDDYTLEADGVWDLEGGAIVFRFSDVDSSGPGDAPEPGVKYTGYYFLADSELMGLSFGDELFYRDGPGSGFYGSWARDDGACTDYVEITNVAGFVYEEVCGEVLMDSITGTYTQDGVRFRVTTVGGSEYFYYKLIGNYLSLIHSSQMFSKNPAY